MQWDIKLNSDGDIDLSTGSMQLISDKKEAILQRFKLKFGTFTKEWFWKQSYGGIDRDLLFTKGVEQQMLDAWFLSKIQEDPDVDQILTYQSYANPTTRTYELTFSILIDDETIEISTDVGHLSTDSEVSYPDSNDYNATIQEAINNQVDVSTVNGGEYVDYIYSVKSSAPAFSVYRINPDTSAQELTFQSSGTVEPAYASHCIGVNTDGTKVALGYISGGDTFADVYIGQTTGFSKIQTLSAPTAAAIIVDKLVWNDDSNTLGVFNIAPSVGATNPNYGHLAYSFNTQLNFLSGAFFYTGVSDDPYVFDSDGRGGWIVGDAAGSSTALQYSSTFTQQVTPQFGVLPYITSRVRQLAAAHDGSFALFAMYTSSPSGVAVYRWVPNNPAASGLYINTTTITAITCLSISYDKRYIIMCNGSQTVLIYKASSTGHILLGTLELPGAIPVQSVKWSKDSRRLYCKRVGETNSSHNLFYYTVDDDGFFTYKADITGSGLTSIYGWDVVTRLE